MVNDPAQNPYTASQTAGTESVSNVKGTIQGTARTGMIITLALVQGLVVISAIMAFMVFSGREDGESLVKFDGDAMLWLVMGGGFAVAGIIAAIVIRMVMQRGAYGSFRDSGVDPDVLRDEKAQVPQAVPQLVGAFQTRTLVGQAVLEGPAVINAIFMFLGANLLHLVPIIILTLGILAQMPTAEKIQRWIENALQA